MNIKNIKLFRQLLNNGLTSKKIRNKDFPYFDFSKIDFSNSDFRNSDFRNSDFRNSDFSYSNFSYSNFSYSNLTSEIGEYLYNKQSNVLFISKLSPDYEFIAWKKVANKIVKLKILNAAKRSNATSYKCRASMVKVLEIQDLEGNKLETEAIQNLGYNADENVRFTKKGIEVSHGDNFIYVVGEIIEILNFDENRWNECAPGIHYFIDRQNAVNY